MFNKDPLVRIERVLGRFEKVIRELEVTRGEALEERDVLSERLRRIDMMNARAARAANGLRALVD